MVAPQYLLDRTPKSSVADLIPDLSDAALASPFRSTVPLLALAKDDWGTFAKVLDLCGMTGDVSLAFERSVPSPRGEGRPSYTDAMVLFGQSALAIEAKWTEPRNETVAARLGRRDSRGQGSEEFVRGWLDLIQPHATKTLRLEDFSDCVYQVVHRAASACGAAATPALLYLVFSTEGGPRKHFYLDDLTLVYQALGQPARFPFLIAHVELKPTAAFKAIERLKKGEAATGRRVRQALLSDILFEFGAPTVTAIGRG